MCRRRFVLATIATALLAGSAWGDDRPPALQPAVQHADAVVLAGGLGIAVNTVKAWLSVLEATFQVFVVRPYFANIGKRLVKTPKVYFADTGTLCYLLGLREPGQAAASPMAGWLFESFVLSEIVRSLRHQGEDSQVYFWRTAVGQEVDFLVEHAGRLVPIEVKLSATPRPAMAAGIRTFSDALGEQVAPGYVVHAGDIRLPLDGGVTALPVGEL
ncbi:DUF4143 domain-containing protein [bacterium]|nr:DUF4143 domain-containing protein [bacterium]